MSIRLRMIISVAVVLMAGSAASSKDGALPTLDIQNHCRANQGTTDAMFGNKNTNAFDLCVNSEQGAHDTLVGRWATISAVDKTSCVHPAAYSPSYFEWLGCIDTRVYVQKMRTDHPVSLSDSGRCPIVKWQSTGSIATVVACKLP
jgi:hypothetical protein